MVKCDFACVTTLMQNQHPPHQINLMKDIAQVPVHITQIPTVVAHWHKQNKALESITS